MTTSPDLYSCAYPYTPQLLGLLTSRIIRMAAASEWCSCAGFDACSIEFSGLGHGDYILGVGIPDSTYLATEGAQGFVRPLGFYGENELAQDVESATVITLSDDQPRADAVVNLRDEGSAEPN